MTQQNKSLSPRKLLKRGLQQLASRTGRHTRKVHRDELVVLMYHRILPTQDPRAQHEEPGMMVTPDTFRMHLETLQDDFEFIPLIDWVSRHDENHAPQKLCAITFDDGWMDNYEFAFPILKELRIPATIFLVSDLIDTDQVFWPERLARLLNTLPLADLLKLSGRHPWLRNALEDAASADRAPTSDEIGNIIRHCKRHSDSEMNQYLDGIYQAVDQEQIETNILNWQQIEEMKRSGLIDFGCHTRRHTRLTEDLDTDTLDDEICTSQSILQNRLGDSVRTFCYPNGDTSGPALERVRVNYECAVSTRSGWNDSDDDPHLLKRIGIHEDISHDRISFLSRLSGWL